MTSQNDLEDDDQDDDDQDGDDSIIMDLDEDGEWVVSDDNDQERVLELLNRDEQETDSP